MNCPYQDFRGGGWRLVPQGDNGSLTLPMAVSPKSWDFQEAASACERGAPLRGCCVSGLSTRKNIFYDGDRRLIINKWNENISKSYCFSPNNILAEYN